MNESNPIQKSDVDKEVQEKRQMEDDNEDHEGENHLRL